MGLRHLKAAMDGNEQGAKKTRTFRGSDDPRTATVTVKLIIEQELYLSMHSALRVKKLREILSVH